MNEIQIPGDKSISHRAIMLSALSGKIIAIENLLFADDVLSTVNAMRALGVNIELDEDKKTAVVRGVGLQGLTAPKTAIDCGNSGTTMRLLSGILAAQSFDSVLIGDESLMKRPMLRIAKPLRQMGAKIELSENNTAPIKIFGQQKLKAIDYMPEVASAQVKSCVLLAGLYASGETTVVEKVKTRDHTERMLNILNLGASLSEGVEARFIASQGVIKIPGDISSAAFFIVAATIVPGTDLLIKQVGVNPLRTGVIDILKLMGADIALQNENCFGEESVADIHIKYTKLKGIQIPQNLIASAIDEFPIIFIAAALAAGQTVLRGAKELRVKETDRIAAMTEGLKILGVPVDMFDDGLLVSGVDGFQGGEIDSFKDHRIAMAFKIASLRATSPVEIKGFDCMTTSFPNFMRLFAKIFN